MSTFERKVEFTAAYDKRNDPAGNFGIHGVEIYLHLIGKKGAVTFRIMTDWMLPHVDAELRGKGSSSRTFGASVCYHSPVPVNDWHKENLEENKSKCDLLPEGACYGDCSFLAGDTYFQALIASGNGIWDKLEQYYKERFGDE